MKIQNKIMFLASVMSAMITFVTSSCSHSSSDGYTYVFDPAKVYGDSSAIYSLDVTKPIEEGEYDGELEHYCYDGVTVAETVVLLSSLTGECGCQTCNGNCDGTVKIRVKDKSEADRRALADVLRSMEEDVKVYLDLHYTYVDAGSYAFANCKSLEGIVLAAHQEELGGGSFSECENLKEVYWPENLKTIGDRAFYDCESLKTVYLPETIESIGEWAFYNCISLTTLTKDGNNKLPKSLKTIGIYAFSDCYALITIDLSETQLKEIPDGAFYMVFSSSSALATVYLPDTIEYIGEWAFYNCEKLTTLTKDGNNKLPKSLKTIGEYVFCRCTSLEKIDLSETQLKEIPKDAFYMPSALATVYLPDTIESIGYWAFYGCSSPLTIEKEEGKAWGHASTYYKEESNPSAKNLTMIPCFEDNTLYFLAGYGKLQCETSCCQEGGETCCGEGGENTCACASITNSGSSSNYGYNYWWYKVVYPE